MESLGLMAIGLQEVVENLVQVVDVFRNEVGQCSVLGLVPHVFHRIEFRGVCRKPFDLEPIDAVVPQLSHGGTMNGQAIADQDDRTAHMSMDFTQEPGHIRRFGIVVKQFVVQAKATGPGSARDRGERGDPVVSVPSMLQRRLANRSPDAPAQWLKQIATFVEKNQASLPFEALFLAAATDRGATERWPVPRARGRAVLASVDSTPACEAISARSPGGTPRQTDVGSCPVPAARSNQRARIPNIEFPVSKRPPIGRVVGPKASASVRHGIWPAEHCHADTQFSNDAPMKHLNPRPQPLSSTTFPAQKAGLRSSDGLPALRGFLWVSCADSNKSHHTFHYPSQTQ